MPAYIELSFSVSTINTNSLMSKIRWLSSESLSTLLQVDITNRTAEVDLSNYVVNGEWELVYIKIVRNVVRYACCEEPFPDVTFYVK